MNHFPKAVVRILESICVHEETEMMVILRMKNKGIFHGTHAPTL
jgi:hypothetical protein